MSNGFYVVPKLVEDTSLKRSRIELQDGSSAIKVSETTPADLSPVTDSLGKTGDAAWNGSDLNATVISLLKGIVNKLYFYIAVYDKAGEIHKLPIITTLSDISDVGPVSYSLNNPPGTTMSIGTDQAALSIARDNDNWYLQATTEWNISHVTPPTLPFDYYVFNIANSHPYLKYAIKMKDANGDTIFILSDSSGNPGVSQMVVSKAVADFNLSYS